MQITFMIKLLNFTTICYSFFNKIIIYNMEYVLDNIKRIRKQKGLSHENIADELNISQAAYSKLENKETKLTLERLYKISEILETKVGDILELKPTNVFNQNNNDNGTFIGKQEIQNLYEENKEKSEKIISLYESIIQEKNTQIENLKKEKYSN